MARRPHIPLFLIFYSTTFTFLGIILVILILVTPADTIYQAYRNDQSYNIIILGASYVITFVLALVIYAQRLYHTRVVLGRVPRSWNYAHEKGWRRGHVGKMIQGCVQRSAEIEWEAKPRSHTLEQEEERTQLHHQQGKESISHRSSNPASAHRRHTRITHPGYSPPSDPHLPNVPYWPVLLELPHLVEAHAIAALPQPPPPTLLSMLQRSPSTGAPEYIAHLASLNVVPAEAGALFVERYQRARWSGVPLTRDEFEDLMERFVDLLGEVRPLFRVPPQVLEGRYTPSASDKLSMTSIDDDALLEEKVRGYDKGEEGDKERIPTIKTASFESSSPLPLSTGSEDEVKSEGTLQTAPSRHSKSRFSSLSRRQSTINAATSHSPFWGRREARKSRESLVRTTSEESDTSVVRHRIRDERGEMEDVAVGQ